MARKPVSQTPAHIVAGVTSGWDRFNVLDADTGRKIDRVVEVDADKGVVRRLKVVGGSLLVENGDFVVITEERGVRIEPIDGADGGKSGEEEA